MSKKSFEELLSQLALERKYSLEDLTTFVNLARTQGRRESQVIALHTSRIADNYTTFPLSIFVGPERYDIVEHIFIAALDAGENNVADFCLARLARKFTTNSARIRRLYCLRFEARGDIDEALKNYDRLTVEDPTDTFAMKRKVAHLKAIGDTKGAITLLNEYLSVFMADTEAWAELADLYTSQQMYAVLSPNRYDEAVFCYEELLIASPQNYHWFTHYAELLYTSGKFAEAANYYSLSLELETENNLRALLGLVLAIQSLKKSDLTPERTTALMKTREKINEIYKRRASPEHRDAILSAINKLIKAAS